MKKILHIGLTFFLMLSQESVVIAQDNRTQFPPVLTNSYFGVSLGYINYNFSQKQLEPGYTAESIHVPHTAVRVVLFGHQFNKYLSAELSYMRPVDWVGYKNVNGSGKIHKASMNIVGLSLRPSFPLSTRISLHADVGAAIVTRGGFIIDNIVAMKDATSVSPTLGGGIEYHLTKNWQLMAGMNWWPSHPSQNQPATVLYSAGFNYVLRPLRKETVEKNANSGYVFPRNMIQAGYTTNALGYGVNDFVSKGAVPVFWGGDAQVARGVSLNYQRNIYHGRKTFSLDWGAGISYWNSKLNDEKFYTISVYPVFRFTLIHSSAADFYFDYSVAGPSFISRRFVDNKDTGKKFTFQDFMGIGMYGGKKRNLNAEIRIAHYSNGNIFPQNNGVMVPLSFVIGYTFN